jgi:hypothetical protein
MNDEELEGILKEAVEANADYILAFGCRDWDKLWKALNRVNSVASHVRTRHLPNTSLEV